MYNLYTSIAIRTRKLSFTRASSAQMRGASSPLTAARLASFSARAASEAPLSPPLLSCPCGLALGGVAARSPGVRGRDFGQVKKVQINMLSSARCQRSTVVATTLALVDSPLVGWQHAHLRHEGQSSNVN